MLLAFKARLGAEVSDALKICDARGILSRNGRSVAWLNCLLPDVALTASLNQQNLCYLMRAKYATELPQTERVDRGIRIERVVHDMTDPKSTENADTPFKLREKIDRCTIKIHSKQ